MLWWLEPEPERLREAARDDVKKRTFAAFNDLLACALTSRALLGGYNSSPRTTDVVSMLKVVMCTEDPVDCDKCPYDSGAKCVARAARDRRRVAASRPGQALRGSIARVRRVTVLVAARSRTTVAAVPLARASQRARTTRRSTSSTCTPAAEIARLEFPAWLTPDQMETLCGAVLDQCAKGMGYPVALSEAHEQAVVRASDRRAFLELARRQNVTRPSRSSRASGPVL